MTIGRRLKDLREKRGLSQYQLADLSKVPRNTIIRIEHGEVDPRISTLRRIAKPLGIKVTQILEG